MLYAVTCTCELTGRRGGDFEFVLSEVMQLEAGEERCREFPLGSVARCGDGVGWTHDSQGRTVAVWSQFDAGAVCRVRG